MKRHRENDDIKYSGIKRLKCLDENETVSSTFSSIIPLEYITKGLRVSRDEIAKMKYEYTKEVLARKKLYLVLDLDNTLLHSTRIPEHVQAKNENLVPGGDTLYIESAGVITKLRPFVRTFLEVANGMFEMYISTRGGRIYANMIARFLDPDGDYFGNRIIAREDCTKPKQKGLDVVLGDESAVVIVDDTEEVWPDDKENLILIEKYFAPKNPEDEKDRMLASVLEVLTEIHKKFFTNYDQHRDVRKVLKLVKDSFLYAFVMYNQSLSAPIQTGNPWE